MKLVRFAVNNFGCITGGLENNCVDFDGSNSIFIFGQNNVGKSTFLKAYEAFYNDSIESSNFNQTQELDIEIEVWFKLDEVKDKEEIDQGTSNKFDNLKTKYLADGLLKIQKTWRYEDKGKAPISQTYNVIDGKWETKSYGGIGTHSVFKALMMRPLFIQAMPTETQVESIVNEILKEAASKKLSDTESEELKNAESVISTLQEKVYDKASIDEYRNKVNERFNTLFGDYEVGIDDGTSKVKYTHDKLGKDFKITFNKTGTDQTSTYLQMGHGAVRMAIFLLMLMRDELREDGVAQKDYLVLFEEPELFLHPILTKRLRNLIYDVSGDDMPFQVLAASHSPQMIDISRDHTSLVRMTKQDDASTKLFQVTKSDLKNAEQQTTEEVKNKVYEILRFDPYICESFYADEVVLVEGDTEAIIWRGYQQAFSSKKDVFVVNCHSCTNIPFYQKIFSKFDIPYSVICDTDKNTGWDGNENKPVFTAGIQKSIADQFYEDSNAGKAIHFLVFDDTFEPAHSSLQAPFIYNDSGGEGKPFRANRYWELLLTEKDSEGFEDVPIIKFMKLVSEN